MSDETGAANGIQFFGRVQDILLRQDIVRFEVQSWQVLKKVIGPVGYGIHSHMMTTLSLLNQSEELPELFMKSPEEIKLWRMLRRLTTNVHTNLDDRTIDLARKVQAYQIGHVEVLLDSDNEQIEIIQNDEVLSTVPLETLRKQPTQAFKIIKETVFV